MSDITNPYVSVVAKKSRNLHKKLDKILKADTQQKSGKVLNDEQLILLTTRCSVEKQLADIDSIKALLEEVAAEEAATSTAASTITTTSTEEVKEEVVKLEAACQVIPDVSVDDIATYTSEIEALKQQVAEDASTLLNLERRVAELNEAYCAKINAQAAAAVVPPPPPSPLCSPLISRRHCS